MSYLYITEQGTRIGLKEHQVVVCREDGEVLEAIPMELLESISVFGNCQITTPCLHLCMGRNIPVLYYSRSGKYYGRLQSYETNSVRRQRKQAVFYETPQALELAQKIISAKIHNQIVLAKRYARSCNRICEREVLQMKIYQSKAAFGESVESIMGFEGSAARIYFSLLGQLVKPDFAFSGRSRRPALDPFNAMLNLGYAMLSNEMYGKIECKGLNPFFGFMHKDREHHATLASDLMEEWRPVVVDSTVMSLVNGHEIKPEHFQTGLDDDGIYLTKEGLEIFLSKMEKKLRQENKYIVDSDKAVSFRRAIELQVSAYAHVTEENNPECYQPVWLR